LGIGFGKLVHPIRAALSGRTQGPGLFDIVALLGKEECLRRLNRAIAFVKAGAKYGAAEKIDP
jgi:nondiscriminating glutamyl-tRNA synthetase